MSNANILCIYTIRVSVSCADETNSNVFAAFLLTLLNRNAITARPYSELKPNFTRLIKVLHLTRRKIGHFGDVLPNQSLGIVPKKLNLIQQ